MLNWSIFVIVSIIIKKPFEDKNNNKNDRNQKKIRKLDVNDFIKKTGPGGVEAASTACLIGKLRRRFINQTKKF